MMNSNMKNKMPNIPESAFVAEGAVVKGEVTIGENSSIWYNATVRADRATITIGDNSLIGMGAILLNNCVIGRNAIHYVEESRIYKES